MAAGTDCPPFATYKHHGPQRTAADYERVAKDIAAILDRPGYDDGSIGPVLVRLAWHAAGTYDRKTKTGGSDGATMRFNPEKSDGANAGLEHARAFLEPIKAKHPWISYADLWTLAVSPPSRPWAGPRSLGPLDEKTVSAKDIPPNGRLPDAAQGASHVRDVFYRMGFNDREIVALLGAHSIGRCHSDRSGFEGPWTYTPTRFSNQYFKLLLNTKWVPKTLANGNKQFVDEDDEIMMLPAEMAFVFDDQFKQYVELYAKDKNVFYADFAAAFGKLLELGVKRAKTKL
ncbi:mitochondrial putative cytochrome c peroxidase [Catenaria anguillulae PL171]|uniref:Peroxidase n=1 Tax=Catenaria anguillulae PL171 TaxID=765915 RepID=A0A1Y2HQS2_9FUNG|nr:mitochondrial putative cytochrome c peroxidase [Catenaria anguillulae PL171]